MTQNALATTRGVGGLPAAQDWQTMLSMAATLVESGMLPKHITTPQAAVAVIQRGIELGVPPMYALSNIVYIQGKPTANSELMLALIYRDHGDGAVIFSRSDNAVCEIAYRRRNWASAAHYAFSLDDAKQAGLLSNQTWQKYPAAMLRARAISAVARMAFPDSIGGMYSPEELGAAVEMDREGGLVIVDSPPVQVEQVEQVERVDASTGEIISSADGETIGKAIQRLIYDAETCRTKGHLRLIVQEAQRLGLFDEPEVLGALKAAKARLVEAELSAPQGQLIEA